MRPSNPISRGRSGLTLGVVLFVVGLALVGAAVLWALYRRSNTRTIETACATNLRQLGTALVMYCMDNEGRLPPYTNLELQLGKKLHASKLPTNSDEPKLLRKALTIYTDEPNWFCPADPVARQQRYYLGIRHQITSYAFPLYADKNGRPRLLSEIPVDSKSGLVWDAAGERSACEDNLWFAGSQTWASNHPDGSVNFVLQDLSVHRVPAKQATGGILP